MTASRERLISLLPGATELVCALGLEAQLVGISHECDYPASITHLPRVTATPIQHAASSLAIDQQVRAALADGQALYQLDLTQLATLRPSLLLSQSLCAVCGIDTTAVDGALCTVQDAPPQFDFAPATLAGLMEAITALGARLGVAERATALRSTLEARVASVAERSAGIVGPRLRVAFLEWLSPFFTGGHWNPELVALAGGESVFGAVGEKSHETDWAHLLASDADVIFIASCGFPVERSLRELPVVADDPRWQALRAVRGGRVYLADGNAYFNRPGPRLVDSLELLAHALHPDVHPLPQGLSPAHQLRP